MLPNRVQKTCVKWPLSENCFSTKTNYHLMQVKRGEHSAILSTFIKLKFVIKIFVLSIFYMLFYTGFTIYDWSLNRFLDKQSSGEEIHRNLKNGPGTP